MAKTMTLTVDTGAVTIEVTDKSGKHLGEFSFIPSDSDILNRYEQVVDFFNAISFPENMTKDQSMKALRQLGDDVRKQLDILLGAGVSDTLFASCGPLTPLENGDFFFENVMDGIGNLIAETTQQRLNKKMKKISAAVKKYGK